MVSQNNRFTNGRVPVRATGYVLSVGWIIVSFVVAAFSQGSVPTRLQQADKVYMLQSKDSTNKPFFQIRLGVPDGIPKLASPTNSIEILEGERTYKPFYVKFGQETSGVVSSPKVSRFVLLVMDVSGSMLDRLAGGQTKFDAAKAAARQFLTGFQPGIDHISVVPFESHQVVSKIRQAVFSSDVQSVQAQIDNLPKPEPNGNTGLYTAIATALEVLNGKKSEDISRTAMLLVLTDGKNDVHKGDDAGLLEGEQGLSTVVASARSSGFPVVTIGFGDTPASIDVTSLRKIASPDHYWSADNLQSLEKVFRQEKETLINQFDVTFATGWSDNRSLMGRDVRFRVRLKADDGRLFESDSITFPTPETSPPPFSGLLGNDEEEAWIRRHGEGGTENIRSLQDVLLSRFLIMAGLGLGLAILWFGLPRMIWPETYLRAFAMSSGAVPNLPSRPQMPGGMAAVGKPNIPSRPQMPRPAGPATAPRPDPSSTVAESKVTIRPNPKASARPPSIPPKGPPRPRQPVDETIVTGAQPLGDTDPWGFDSPPDAPPKR